MPAPLAHLDRCIEVAGDVRAGHFLHKLLRWFAYTKVTFGTSKWVAMTRAEWAKETKTSPKMVRTDLDKLTAKGLIVREQHKFKGSTPLFVRPSEKCVLLLTGAAQDGPLGTAQDGPYGPTLYKPEYKHGVETKLANGSAVADSDTGNVIKFPAQGGAMPTVAETMAKQFASAKPIDTLKPDKAQGLITIWKQELVARKLPVPTVTGKVAGQFKHLLNAWPDGKAAEIVRYAVRHWDDLIYKAEQSHGAFHCPEVPNLGFLLKYAHVVVELMSKKTVQSIAQKSDDKNAAYLESLKKKFAK